MPLIKRKAVELSPVPTPPNAATDPDPDVFYLEATGEIFLEYETYANRLTFYKQPIFQCELTGKAGMTYFQACDSERKEATLLHRRFPEPLKGPVLRSIQFVITGRLDKLVDMVFDRFNERFFPRESVYVDLQGDRYYASIQSVFPPRALMRFHADKMRAENREKRKGSKRRNGTGGEDEDSDLSDPDDDPAPNPEVISHQIGTDLDLEDDEANAVDDPHAYHYAIQLVDDDGKFTGSLMEVKANNLKRDRLTFSKTILRKYIREAVVRDPSVGSPWIVRHLLAQKYNIPITPSEEVIRKNKEIKEGKLVKRRKLLAKGDDDDDAADRPKKRKKTDVDEPVEELKPEKKKVIKYPIEDLDVAVISTRELKVVVPDERPRRIDRPPPVKELPVPREHFEAFMMVYYFLHAVGKPLALSPFTLDDFEGALNHQTHEPVCTLMAEIHGSLINAIVRDGSHSKGLAPAAIESKVDRALGNDDDELDHSVSPSARGDGESDDELASDSASIAGDGDEDGPGAAIVATALSIGTRWEKRILKAEEGRKLWQASLVGCIAKRGSKGTMPRYMGILSHLTGIEHEAARTKQSGGVFTADTYATPVERYPVLDFGDKLSALQFLCELAVMTKPVKAFFEDCEGQLTELRKEKVEVGRAKKKLTEDRAALEKGEKKEGGGDDGGEGGAAGATTNGDDHDGPDEASNNGDPSGPAAGEDEEMDELESDPGSSSGGDDDENASDDENGGYNSDARSDTGSAASGSRPIGARQESLRQKALEREASARAREKQTQREREKQNKAKAANRQANNEKRRLDEEESRLARREEAIEREFRKFAHVHRMTPMGRDRFYDRYWWFDGVGNASLVGQGGNVVYGTGRIFVQGAAAEDVAERRKNKENGDVEERRKSEHGPAGLLEADEWAVYEDPEQIDELLAWLRAKGNRESALRGQIIKFRTYIQQGMRKRLADQQHWRGGATGTNGDPATNGNGSVPPNGTETRRSVRAAARAEGQAAFLQYRNLMAK